jgi:hypothetical protein
VLSRKKRVIRCTQGAFHHASWRAVSKNCSPWPALRGEPRERFLGATFFHPLAAVR